MYTKLAILALSLTAVALAAEVKKEITFENRIDHLSWLDYKTKFGKSYENKAVELDRMLTFLKNKDFIRKHNEAYAQGTETFWLDLNKFADMTPSELKKYNGFKPELVKKSMKNSLKFSEVYDPTPSNGSVPEAIDWRTLGYVTDVKDQGQCGSCWAFSATGSLEGQNFRKTGKLVSLSEQNLMDCSGKYGNEGCDGGLMDLAFQYVIDNKGIDSEPSYPYETRQRRCRYKKEKIGGTEISFVDIEPSNGEVNLKTAVGTQGPVSVAIDAENDLMWYGGGIYKSKQCSSNPHHLNHGVLAVGYGTDAKKGDYWIVKNSWGESWGEDGYVRMARNNKNMCGISDMASYPVV
jgi:cathepsin L